METKMNRVMLENKIYYYPDGVKNFSELMKTIDDVDSLDQENGAESWLDWTASNDKNFIYGKTKSFDINEINRVDSSPEYKEKMKYIYDTIQESFYDVSADYAKTIGDPDEPRLFPTFNIKKYNSGIGMGSHFDQLDGDKTLRYSLVMYLNDDFDGGEISFLLSDYEDVKKVSSPDLDYEIALGKGQIQFGIKPKAGSIIIFPSAAPYYHTAHVVKSNFKYMVPGHWIHNHMELNNSQGNYGHM
jgi:hypothetical protein